MPPEVCCPVKVLPCNSPLSSLFMSHQFDVRLIKRFRPATSAAGLYDTPAKDPGSPLSGSSTSQSPELHVSALASVTRKVRVSLPPLRSVVMNVQVAPGCQSAGVG